ncbi:MAG: MFS transporter [Bacteroidales bacterium]|nr:MFS transporter [Bacteroidales bacterium]
MSFFSTVVPVIMRQEKYSLEAIGMLQLVKLPWILKFLWAPMVDKTSQNNKDLKRWIILSELFYAFVIISIGLFSLKTDFKLIVILMVVAFIASATQDIATDAFAILNLKKSERAYGNSMQSAGSFVGSLLGTGVLLIAYFYFGWSVLLFLLAAFVLIAIIPLFLYKDEKKLEKNNTKSVKFTDIFTFFTNKKTILHLPVLIFYYSGIIGVLAMLKPYLVDLGYDVKQIGFMSGIVGTAIAVISSLLAGYVVKKISVNKALISFLFISLAAVLYFVYITNSTPTLAQIYIGIGLLWGSYGFATVAIYTKSMEIVRNNREGTDFTLQIVITHLSSMIIAIFSGKIGDKIGYNGLFKYEAILVVITLVIVIFSIYLNKKIRNGNR